MRPRHTITLLAILSVSVLASGCDICRTQQETVTVLGSTGPFVHAAGSKATLMLSDEGLIGIDGNGRATFATRASWGDLTIGGSYSDSTVPPGSIALSMREIADALVQTQLDLRAARPGDLLAGRRFALDCARNPDGCVAYDQWSRASASATATVVPPASTPAPLLTLQLDGHVTMQSGTTFAFSGTLPFDLHDIVYQTGQSGDCS